MLLLWLQISLAVTPGQVADAERPDGSGCIPGMVPLPEIVLDIPVRGFVYFTVSDTVGALVHALLGAAATSCHVARATPFAKIDRGTGPVGAIL